MTYLLVPQDVTAETASLWVGALDEDAADVRALAIRSIDGTISVSVGSAWDGKINGGGRSVAYRRVDVAGLAARHDYRFELRLLDALVSDAAVTTLPDRLPGLEERPFTILLGSCFGRRSDAGGTVGRAYTQLPAGARPDVKILCGDQVYLDDDSAETWNPMVSADALTRLHLSNYASTWTQVGGFRELLRSGANFFASDDHDFWNNAPSRCVTAPPTLVPGGAEQWLGIASGLYAAFQRRVAPLNAIFKIGDFSVCVADTRFHREPHQVRFMAPGDMAVVQQWAASLRGPGCLVVGQPILAPPGGWLARMKDLGLPDYDQYRDLVRAISQAPHSIVVLTGDVHFGRVAVSELGGGRELIEVISSPLALVSGLARGHWQQAPDWFPVAPIPGLQRSPVWTAPDYAVGGSHFATLEFALAGAYTRMRVRAWPLDTAGRPPVPFRTFERWIA